MFFGQDTLPKLVWGKHYRQKLLPWPWGPDCEEAAVQSADFSTTSTVDAQ